jgi:hypothetical protein
MLKSILYFLTLFLCIDGLAQNDTITHNDSGYIKVHFLYGSKPKKGYKKTESKWFGGLHGGHVSIESEGFIYGFLPYKSFHVVGKKRADKRHSRFSIERVESWVKDTATLKYTTITIPVSKQQIDSLHNIHRSYLKQPPYDYAFIGMRCAAATYDILGQIGIVDWKPNRKNKVQHFYPKLLRKKLLKLAAEKGYKVQKQKGRDTRKWERD